MYKFIFYADIIIVIIASIIIFSLLIFPIFINGDIYYRHGCGKVYYGLYLFGIFKIISGYAELLHDGIALHLTEKKAKILFFKNILNMGKSVKPLQDYHIIRACVGVELGNADSFTQSIFWGYVINFIFSSIKCGLNISKPHVVTDSDITVYDIDAFNIYGSGIVVFNILMIIISIFKIIVEKIFNGKRK